MTPFGEKVRALREARGILMKKMAADLGVSSAYLSALEHGHRGRPGPGLVRQISAYFELGWDDDEGLTRLAAISHPKVTVDTSGLTPKATELANTLAAKISGMDEDTLDRLLDDINGPDNKP
ncbi:MAG: helix-turn-helix transcriptional regulator [Rhodospirillaceae bacterium]|nr:helix-turn-helix transcriptional regulator [Rhodospirillaceae bacterium]